MNTYNLLYILLIPGIAFLLYCIYIVCEEEDKKRKKDMEEENERFLEEENDEYNYGHNVSHYHSDGDGE